MVGIIARVGEKGQVVIPKPIRDNLGISRDSEVIFDVEDNRIVMEKKVGGREAFERFISAVKKRKLPKKIDWNKEYYSQFE
ncbi:MAG TPA: AbrB/MazE/SpoVT family DNA-binding domain-containing protein [Candidatus Nanoarchaeia archaeon]|nr:AbrB/MazE/SpoVT family DNA-binding domain-containing protein [Candidatus Nanoarchaeia archaeon]